MQAHDLSHEPSVDNYFSDPTTTYPMSDSMVSSSPPIHPGNCREEPEKPVKKSTENNGSTGNNVDVNSNINGASVVRRERPSRACTQRAAARLQAAAQAEAAAAAAERKKKGSRRRERFAARLAKEVEEEEEVEEVEEEEEEEEKGEEGSPFSRQQSGRVVTPLVGEPEPSQLPRWKIRSMWQLASILNFLNIFRPLLNINAEFSVEEFETALITPNNTLGDIHMPLLKAIPPIARMALGYNTWVTVLCRKLRDWWHWVAEGDLPIVACHGAEVQTYNTLDPAVRVVILKALCDIRVEQEDIRNYIDNSIKHGVHLSAFRKERIGGDSHGVSYWYEDDSVIGQRLYREIRKVEVKKGKGKNVQSLASYQWEAVATNLDEFQDVSVKLFSSKNRTEVSVGKRLKNDMLPEIEKVHKRKEKLLKKQHRQALLLDNMINMDGIVAGRSLRGRRPVTYTFDDFDRSINEAIKLTKKKQPSPEPNMKRELTVGLEPSINGRWEGPSQFPHVTFKVRSPKSADDEDDESDDDSNKDEQLDRSNRRRQRPQRYSAGEFIEAVSDMEADFDSEDDIVGEAVYDEEYLRKRKQRRKMSSSSEEDEEYHMDGENHEDEDEEDDDEDASLSASDGSDEPRKFKKLPGRTRRGTRLRSVDELQTGLRRSNRANRNRINYRQYELSESEESTKPEKSVASDDNMNGSEGAEFSMVSQDSESEGTNNDDQDNEQDMKVEHPMEEHPEMVEKEQINEPEKSDSPSQDELPGIGKRRFLDLNELAPDPGFDDASNSTPKDEDAGDF